MKTSNLNKFVAVISVVSLVFLQGVPAGLAARTPVDQRDAITAPTSEKPVDKVPESPAPEVKSEGHQTSIDSLMNTGGILPGGPQHRGPKPGILEKLPPAVQALIDQLKEKLSGFNVTVTALKCGPNEKCMGGYAISIVDAKQYAKAPDSGLHSINFNVTKDGTIDPKSITAAYYSPNGELKMDGALLYEMMDRLYLPNVIETQSLSDVDKLVKMTQISVTKVDQDGAIHFTLNGAYWKVSRSENGKILLEGGWPIAVQNYADRLKEQLGHGYSVKISPHYSPAQVSPPEIDGWTVEVQDTKQYTAAPTRGLQSMSFQLDNAGNFVQVLSAAYYAPGGKTFQPDAQLLFEGMRQLLQTLSTKETWDLGVVLEIETKFITDQEVLVAMTQISVTKIENGAIFFTKEGKNYKAYRDTDGTVKLEEIIPIPPEVQNYVTDLQQKVGDGFKVTATLQKDGTYLVTVTDSKVHVRVPTRGLHTLSFNVAVDGTLDPQTIRAAYYGPKGDLNPDGKLLFQAMGVCPEGQVCTQQVLSDVDKLVKMTQISVTKVENGAVFFTKDGKNYKTYRDAAGTVKLEEVKPISAGVQLPDGVYESAKANLTAAELAQLDAALLDIGPNTQCSLQTGPNGETSWTWVSGSDANKRYTLSRDVVNGVEHFTFTITQSILPPAVQAYVDSLQAALGHGYIVSAVHDGEFYRIAVNFRTREDCTPDGKCPQVIFIPNPGQLTHMSFKITADGLADISTLVVNYNIGSVTREDALNGVIPPVVDAQLLFEAMGVCPQGQVCTQQVVSDVDKLVKMTQISVTKVENGAIFYTLAGKNYKAYRAADGKVKVEPIIPIPPAVQAFVDQLNGELGNNYHAAVLGQQPDGTYLVSLASTVKQALQGHLGNMSFVLNAEGLVVSIQQVTFVDIAGVDGELLFEGMKAFAQKNGILVDVQALLLLTQISVTKVDQDGAIFFTKDGVNYITYRGADGKVVVRTESEYEIINLVTEDLSARLGIESDQVSVVRFGKVEWPDSCLGVNTGGACKQVITPGYDIFLEANGVIYNYHTDLHGRFILAQQPETTIPPAVQGVADKIQAGLGADYSVKAELSPGKNNPPRYLVTVLYTPANERPGQLRSMVLRVSEDGKLAKVQNAKFDGIEAIDGQLLFRGMRRFSDARPVGTDPLVWRLKMMSLVTVTRVTKDSIRFSLDGKDYRVDRPVTVPSPKVEIEKEDVLVRKILVPGKKIIISEGQVISKEGKEELEK